MPAIGISRNARRIPYLDVSMLKGKISLLAGFSLVGQRRDVYSNSSIRPTGEADCERNTTKPIMSASAISKASTQTITPSFRPKYRRVATS
jgi:hypothetical protein